MSEKRKRGYNICIPCRIVYDSMGVDVCERCGREPEIKILTDEELNQILTPPVHRELTEAEIAAEKNKRMIPL